MIPYGKQTIDTDDIDRVVEVLKSDFLTTGPVVDKFEDAVAKYVNAKYAVAVSSGTAALHAAMYSIGVKEGDEVITTSMTFVATSNSILYSGAKPVFADIDIETMLIDPSKIENKITERTKAIVVVDYAGQPCNYKQLKGLAKKYNLVLISDACHAIGAEYNGEKVGSIADITCFSFHPVKHITTGEGGMLVTNNEKFATRAKTFRSHGINIDYKTREKNGSWFYEMTDLGYNYRITDFQCALGLSQLNKLDEFITKRNNIAEKYNEAFSEIAGVTPLINYSEDNLNAYHLYVIKVENRDSIFKKLRDAGIGVNVHYIPVHLHPYYIKELGTSKGDLPIAEQCYEEIISLPIFPSLSLDDINYVVEKVKELLS